MDGGIRRGRDLSPNTERAYAGRVAVYLTFCSIRGLDWRDPGFLELRRFRVTGIDKIGPQTVRREINSLLTQMIADLEARLTEPAAG
ncbi:hypothetical protein Airi02_014720 [Actinoallomurus iriomotensis]|uniref:Integrase n=1 Tax=Actinoallomurus iriomotensis TaxID=478107 RepID=A0A9W6VYC7_9ACTN|nr:hypothetical protein Airi02_014720 [Actinoallomurus iriomotensis]